MASSHPKLRFGPYELDPRAGDLRKEGRSIRLQEKSLRILVALVENPTELVTRQELQRLLWPGDTFVDFENGLNTAVAKLREALCDNSETPRYIETVRGRGYRFLVPVERPAPEKDSQAAPVTSPGLLPVASPPGSMPSQPEASAGGSPETSPENSTVPPAAASSPKAAPRPLLYVAAAVALIGVVLLAALWFVRGRVPAYPETDRLRLAVLPFQNLTGDPEQDYVSDGFTEEIITKLGETNQQRVAVIARTSAMSYKGAQKPIKEIARELNVAFVLEGSVRKTSDGYRITAQLIRADDQTHLWARDYDRPIGQLVQVQGEVAQAVAEEIQVKLAPESGVALASAKPNDPDSYRAYLRGRYFLAARSHDGLTNAVAAFQESIAKDPGFAPAYAGLADAYNLLVYYGYPPGHDGIPKALEAAQRSIELDPNLARGHAALGYIDYMWRLRWPEAEQEFRKAIALDSNYSTAHHWYAQFLASNGRQKEAIEQIKIAEELDPRSLIVVTAHGYILYFGRDYDAAAVQCQVVLDRNPDFMVAHAVLGLAEEQRNHLPKAIAEFQKALELSGGRPIPYLDYLGHAYALAGEKKKAEAILAEIDRAVGGDSGGQAFRAPTLAALGRKSEAIDALEEGYVDGGGPLIWLKVDPRLDPLGADPRFKQLLSHYAAP